MPMTFIYLCTGLCVASIIVARLIDRSAKRNFERYQRAAEIMRLWESGKKKEADEKFQSYRRDYRYWSAGGRIK